MGWLALLILAAATIAGLWPFVRRDRGALQFLLATLLAAAAGYVWQGRPALPGQPKSAQARAEMPDTAFAQTRDDMLGRFNTSWSWLNMADAYHRRGDTAGAAQILQSAIRANPDNYALWVGLGYALFVHGDGMVNPASQLAFQRAAALAPEHPAPRFYFALTLAQSGQLDEAERIWRELLADAPPDASWRPLVETSLGFVAEARARGAGQVPGGPPPAQ